MPRFKLTIEYAGTRYRGWQIQTNARTVQGEIARAAREVSGRADFELYGSGRTDAGVHALSQVAHLDIITTLPAETLRRRLNDALPADISVLAVEPVPHRFHARHDAVARRYLYQIARRRTALAKAFVWWVKEPLDLEAMRAAASAFRGMKDFRAFAETDRTAPPSTLVLVDRLDVVADGDLILVAIEGSHFLWKMVRRIVGVLVAVGRGDLDATETTRLLAGGKDVPAALTAPPSGLFLERVYYGNDARIAGVKPATPLATPVPSTSRTTPS